jgi:hypothetical protein
VSGVGIRPTTHCDDAEVVSSHHFFVIVIISEAPRLLVSAGAGLDGGANLFSSPALEVNTEWSFPQSTWPYSFRHSSTGSRSRGDLKLLCLVLLTASNVFLYQRSFTQIAAVAPPGVGSSRRHPARQAPSLFLIAEPKGTYAEISRAKRERK